MKLRNLQVKTNWHTGWVAAMLTAITLASLAAPLAAWAQMPRCDTSHYVPVAGLNAEVTPQLLRITWNGDPGQQLQLQFDIRNQTPVIADLSLHSGEGKWVSVLANATPEYEVTTGLRRIPTEQMLALEGLHKDRDEAAVAFSRWETYTDGPLNLSPNIDGFGAPKDGVAVVNQPGVPRSPAEIQRAAAKFEVTSCTVRTDGAQLSVDFPGVELGPFKGLLRFTFYRGTNLIRQEFIGQTAQNWVAYKYNAGLKGVALTPASRLVWTDRSNYRLYSGLQGDPTPRTVVLQTANRVAAVEQPNGAVAAFQPPHFLWPRDRATNMGHSWYRVDPDHSLAFGVLQNDHDDPADEWLMYGSHWTLYNARPGTDQSMAMFLFPVLGTGQEAINKSLAFTNGDKYRALPGFKVWAHHFHFHFTERMSALRDPAATLPDVAAMKAVGVNILSPVEDPYGGLGWDPIKPDEPSADKRHLDIVHSFVRAAKSQSDNNFLLMYSEELSEGPLGGHDDLIFSHPVAWVHADASQPAERSDPVYGKIYNIRSPQDLMRMVDAENAIISMPHPRTKLSAGFPDAIKDEPYFSNPRYVGMGMRWGMGIDGSEHRLCDYRCWPLLDDLSNWMVARGAPLKKVLPQSDLNGVSSGDDIYGNTPVTYLQLAKLPTPDDTSAVLDVIRNGYSFWTTGEILVPSFELRGSGRAAKVIADVQWTFPLAFVEVVWGDGKMTGRKIISATELAPFGTKRFEIPFDARGKHWVRFAVWDIAAGGAVLQPVQLRH